MSGAGREGRGQGEMRWGKVRLSLGLSAGVVRGGARARRGGAGLGQGRVGPWLNYTLGLGAGGRGRQTGGVVENSWRNQRRVRRGKTGV